MLLLSAFGTSILSGLVGMAGGLLLMGILAASVPVGMAMILHGSTQGVANGFRALLLFKHIRWHVLGGHGIGAILAALILQVVSEVPPVWLVFLGIGSMPILGRLAPFKLPDITKVWWCAPLAGLLVCLVQGVAGVAGPVLDLFFLESSMERQGVVATKAITQALSHLLKLWVYWSMAGSPVSGWLVFGMALAAVAGTAVGAAGLERVSEGWFKRVSQAIVMGIGVFYLAKGIWVLI
jgi:uncharacterized membrane protein YfcA